MLKIGRISIAAFAGHRNSSANGVSNFPTLLAVPTTVDVDMPNASARIEHFGYFRTMDLASVGRKPGAHDVVTPLEGVGSCRSDDCSDELLALAETDRKHTT